MGIFLISLFVVLLDQATKLYVKGCTIPFLGLEWHGHPLYTSVPLLGDFVRFTYIENAGMAFGIDVGGKLYFSLFSILASIVIFVYLYKIRKEPFLYRLPIAFILGGAAGNLVDRVFYGVLFHEGDLFYGRVVDFIDVDFFDVNILGYQMNRWPVFNVADASVTIGIISLLIVHQFYHKETAQQPVPADGAFEEEETKISSEHIPLSPHDSIPS